jgi:hypothetical protein
MARSMISRGTGSLENSRTVRRRQMSSWNRRTRSSISGSG